MIHNRTAEENRQQLHRSLHLTDYFAILREHKWLAVIPFALIVAGSVGLTLFATPVYTAEAMVEIDTQSGAQGSKDMGKVMKTLIPMVGGRADGKLVSELVKSALG